MSYIRSLMVVVALLGAVTANAQAVLGQGSWETTLLGRDINRNAVDATDNSAVYLYDTTLGVTWLRNANVNGAQTWDAATAWAANLTTGSGSNTISDWRLPTMAITNPDGRWGMYNASGSSSEMASLFYDTLGNKAYYDIWGNVNAGYGVTQGEFLLP